MTSAIVDFDAGEGWGSETIPLKHPFHLNGVDYYSVEMRIATGVDAVRFYTDPKRSLPAFAIGLTLMDDATFGRLHGEDAGQIIDKARGFLFGALET